MDLTMARSSLKGAFSSVVSERTTQEKTRVQLPLLIEVMRVKVTLNPVLGIS